MFGIGQLGRLGLNGGRSLASQIMAMSPKLLLGPSVSGGYQDSAGTTALYAPGGGLVDPPVGLALDKSGNANDASQATSTARPVLSARKNLLTYTEDFSNAAWSKSGSLSLTSGVLDPNGGATAFTLLNGGANGDVISVPITVTIGTPYTTAWYIRRRTGIGIIRMYANTASTDITASVTASWSRVVLTATPSGTTIYSGIYLAAGDAVDVWYPQTELGSTATPYQRVTTASDYDASAAPLYWKFDGVDDVHNVTFPSSLGSACTVVTANRNDAPTILTAQTIGTSLAINATHCGKLVFDRALTAGETAVVTAWANKQGGL